MCYCLIQANLDLQESQARFTNSLSVRARHSASAGAAQKFSARNDACQCAVHAALVAPVNPAPSRQQNVSPARRGRSKQVEPCLCVDHTSLIASGVPMPAARGSPAGPNQWFCGAPAAGRGRRGAVFALVGRALETLPIAAQAGRATWPSHAAKGGSPVGSVQAACAFQVRHLGAKGVTAASTGADSKCMGSCPCLAASRSWQALIPPFAPCLWCGHGCRHTWCR